MKVRVSDYIANYLNDIGVRSVFMLSGGGMMHLIDAIGKIEEINYYCNHHEQASAMAAEGYARQTGSLGVCYATSGPGGTNTVTGIAGAWVDSAPILFLTGQSNLKQTIEHSQIKDLRQFGTFEIDIVPIVKSITKYSVFLNDPDLIRYHLEKAIYLALNGRPGPVLIDIPLNLQGALIDPEKLVGYEADDLHLEALDDDIQNIIEKLKRAKRPLILAGHGIRCANEVESFKKLVKYLNIPVVTTQLGKDCLPYDEELFIGHPGVKGDRAGNFAVQNADVILSLGCSLHAQTTGYEIEKFAVDAFIIQVDLDPAILQRENIGVNFKMNSDITSFLNNIITSVKNGFKGEDITNWQQKCGYWKKEYAVIKEPHKMEAGPVNFYEFADMLSSLLQGNETIVTDAGSAFYVMGQAFKLKEGQRYIVSGGLGAMGYALPSSIGIATINNQNPVICVTGDGSLQTNIQELQTLSHYGLNVKLFVINNDGYVSIRNTQNSYFNGHFVGTSRESGVSIPPLQKISEAYNIPFVECGEREYLYNAIVKTLLTNGPVICGITAQSDQVIIPTVSSVKLENGTMVSKPLHDMFPFLSEHELKSNTY